MKLDLELTVERFFAVPPLTDSPGLLHHLGRISEDARNVDCVTLTCELQAPFRGLYYLRKTFFCSGQFEDIEVIVQDVFLTPPKTFRVPDCSPPMIKKSLSA